MDDLNIPRLSCKRCADGEALDFDFTMAFQPVVNVSSGLVFAQEALVRGLQGEGARTILAAVNADNMYRFDQVCRVKAVKLAAELGLKEMLSINFLPNAIYTPETCIRTTVAATETYGFPLERIIFEVSEAEKVLDHAHLKDIFRYYRACGFLTAIDDFGAGFAGLGLLAEFTPHIIKLDMNLIRGIDSATSRQAIVKGVLGTCRELGIRVIAEGVETVAEMGFLRNAGIELFQGYLFARPEVERLPQPRLPE